MSAVAPPEIVRRSFVNSQNKAAERTAVVVQTGVP